MRKNYLVYGTPKISQDEIDEVVDSLKSGWIGTGPKVHKFEELFREYIGVKYAMAVGSCTAGLHLSLIAMGIKSGDEVIVPSMTFAASANSVVHVGATPVLVDVNKETMTIDPESIKKHITPKTRAIMPVHFAGRACNIGLITEIAREYNLKIVHDAAHAIETEYYGKKIGSFDDITSYSFYVTKNLTTAEGGMITTNNDDVAEKIKIYALHGMSKDAWRRYSDDGYKHYQVLYPGFKYNMTDIQASLGLGQLAKIEEHGKRRKEIWDFYKHELRKLPLILPQEAEANTRHAYHLYTVLLDLDKVKITRDDLLTALHKQNIGTGVHYIALHLQPYYQSTFGYKRGDLPNSEFISDRTLSLPFSANLTDEDLRDVVDALKVILE